MTLLIVGVTLRLFVGEIAVRGADQCFDKFLRIHRPVCVPQVNAVGVMLWESRLRLFHDKAGNIGS